MSTIGENHPIASDTNDRESRGNSDRAITEPKPRLTPSPFDYLPDCRPTAHNRLGGMILAGVGTHRLGDETPVELMTSVWSGLVPPMRLCLPPLLP
jgi:hypothetical protein